MFNILHDSIFDPKGLIKQVKRSGWFVFLYILILALFMSLANTVRTFAYDNSTINYETSGCRLFDNHILCDGYNYDPDNMFYLHNIRTYVLDNDLDFTTMAIPNEPAIVVQGDSIAIYYGTMRIASTPYFSAEGGFESLEAGLSMFSTILLFANIVAGFINNLIVIILIILISTLMFLRFRKEISYGKLFKLTVFAATPIALLITFYNIIMFSDWFFFIMGFFAYMPMFRLNREIFYQSMARKYQQEQGNVVDSIEHDEVEAEDIGDDDDDDRQ